MTTTTTPRRRLADRGRAGGRVFTPEQLTDEHRLIGADGRRVRRQRGAAGARPARAEGLGAGARRWCSAAASSACSAPTCPRRYGGVELDKVAVDRRRRGGRPVRRRSRRRSARRPASRSRRSSASAPRRRRRSTCRGLVTGEIDRRLRAERVGLRLRCARRQGARDAAAGRQLRCLNGEKMWITNGGFADLFIVFAKVDGERLHRLHRRARVPRREHRQGRAQDGPARLVDDAADPAGRAGAGRERARRDRQGPQGRVQRRSTTAASSSARCAAAARARSIGEAATYAAQRQAVRPADRHRSAPSSTSSAR